MEQAANAIHKEPPRGSVQDGIRTGSQVWWKKQQQAQNDELAN